MLVIIHLFQFAQKIMLQHNMNQNPKGLKIGTQIDIIYAY